MAELNFNHHSVAFGTRRKSHSLVATVSTDDKKVIGVWRIFYIILAGLFFSLGIIGIVLPGLPTTPFLLLTSYFLARSWPRVNHMLLANRLLGPILNEWQQHGTVDPHVKMRSFIMVGVIVLLLVLFTSLPPILLAVVLALTSTGLLVIYRLPTFNGSDLSDS